MNASLTLPLGCAQCGRALPTEPAERSRWSPRELIAGGQLDELTAPMLLCPECDQEDLRGDYDAGEVD